MPLSDQPGKASGRIGSIRFAISAIRFGATHLKPRQAYRAALYARLGLAGLDEAPCRLAVFVEPDPEQGPGLGRRTMPETVAFSAAMAMHTPWLAARAAGLGLGWVSILDPAIVAAALDVPGRWTLIGYRSPLDCLDGPRRPQTPVGKLRALGGTPRRQSHRRGDGHPRLPWLAAARASRVLR